MLPASVLVFHSHPLVLQQHLYLPYSETTFPQDFILPESTLTFPPPRRMPLFGPWPPEDICTLFRSPPDFLLVSLGLLWSLWPIQEPSNGVTMPIDAFDVALSTLLAL